MVTPNSETQPVLVEGPPGIDADRYIAMCVIQQYHHISRFAIRDALAQQGGFSRVCW